MQESLITKMIKDVEKDRHCISQSYAVYCGVKKSYTTVQKVLGRFEVSKDVFVESIKNMHLILSYQIRQPIITMKFL